MTKQFEVPRLHKYEDWVDQQIADTVHEIVTEFYEVDSFDELTEEQVDSINQWVEENDPFFLGPRFREMIDNWYYENEAEGTA